MLSEIATRQHAGVSLSDDFEAYVAARGPALLRLAYVLTGNESDAQDVVQEALSRALPRWQRITSADDPDAYLRRMVVNAHVSWWRKFRRKESPVHEVVVPGSRVGADDETVTKAGNDELWAACAGCREISVQPWSCGTTSSCPSPRSRP